MPFYFSERYTGFVRSGSIEKAAVLRRIRGWRAAGEQERKVACCQALPSPAISLAQAMELENLAGHALGSDPVRDREVERVRAQWRRLRAFGP